MIDFYVSSQIGNIERIDFHVSSQIGDIEREKEIIVIFQQEKHHSITVSIYETLSVTDILSDGFGPMATKKPQSDPYRLFILE